jgi:hypothetical protein
MINWECPNKPPKFDRQFYNEIHSGMWHSRTSRECLHELNDVLCGLIFFIDWTHIALKERLSLCPVMFSLSIIPQWLQVYSFTWQPLGFVKKLSSNPVHGQNMTNHHQMLKAVFCKVVDAQKAGGISCTLPNPEGQGIHLTFKVPLCFIVGDVKGHDMLCGHYQSHHMEFLSWNATVLQIMPQILSLCVPSPLWMILQGCNHLQTRKKLYRGHHTMI